MSRPDYGPFSRALHRVALGSRIICQASFDIEELAVKVDPAGSILKPVFIAGLARSGSTILLHALYQSGSFRSLTYRDMPFVLMTGVWQRLSSSSQIHRESRERAHGDRVMVEYDSPEAFEEVFWRAFYGDKYIFPGYVTPHDAPKSVRGKFERFVQHVLNSRENQQQVRYLSKNNNNVLRLPTLKRVFPDALVLIPFREPLQQAISLHKQHQLFTEMHAGDRFSRDYMNWLGHFEFGQGHRHYKYSDTANPFDPQDINYWLQCWLDTYRYATKSAPADAIYLGYEQVCEAPADVFARLFPRLDLHTDTLVAAAYYKGAEEYRVAEVNADLLESCKQLHRDLVSKHADW